MIRGNKPRIKRDEYPKFVPYVVHQFIVVMFPEQKYESILQYDEKNKPFVMSFLFLIWQRLIPLDLLHIEDEIIQILHNCQDLAVGQWLSPHQIVGLQRV
jgi:hypothetical protein